MGFLKGISQSATATNPYVAQNPGNDPRVAQQYGVVAQNQTNQNQLAQALQNQANGNGAVQGVFQNNINQIARDQAGSIANQKGISPALAAQLTSQMGGQAMQNAAGMGAQQQLQSQAQLGNLYGQIGNEALGQQQVSQAGILGTNNINANVAGQNASMVNQTTGGFLNAIGGAGAALLMAKGGRAPDPGFKSFLAGGHVPGTAAVPGDSTQNDTVKAMLSPGEIVIPRSLVHNPEKAKAFIEAINRGSDDEGRPKHYGDVLKKKREIQMRKQKDGSYAS